ncbi:MAG: RNA 2',3'-cyclic phosphodiesterase [Deltaproteobacteria bacterium]|jgi:2'-5' RNA ligase|nr:RNA 2',3'-cyclic phosphodiesterase [Deltaproteobacteria bacterium]
MKSKLRTFVAIELPESRQDDIRKLQHAFASQGLDIRWVKPMNLHLTLSFLGDVDPPDIDAVESVLSGTAANTPIFDLSPRGMGVFPNIRKPRILWVGMAGQTDMLRSVQKSVVGALVPLGFAADKRPYRGHLTIGRIKPRRTHQGRLVGALRTHQEFVSQAFTVKRLVIFKSDLRPDGPVYTRLCKMPLGTSTTLHPNIS